MSVKANNGFEALLAETNECLKRAGEALTLGVEGMQSGGYRQTYLQQQATSVASVALDVNLLVSHGRFENVVGLCRIGFESRINLYAAMRVPEFVAQKYLAGAKGNVEQLEEMVKDEPTSPLFQRELENHKNLLEDMRRDFKGIEEKPWCKFKDVVKAAGLMREYEAHYGEGGIWGRWAAYSWSGHGNNKILNDLLQNEGADYSRNFQFSILETADTNASKDDVLARETHWKNKLCSRECHGGYNAN